MSGDRPARGALLVTGMPRSGTSWVGKMLEAGGGVVYVNEPMNPRHPPGRCPGVLDAAVRHYFHYICPDNETVWLAAFRRTAGLRFGMGRELRANHRPSDIARAAKYAAGFGVGRALGRRAMLDDPYAVLSVGWLDDRVLGAAVVLVRDPVAVVGSWLALGWSVDTMELLSQPLLMRDHLEPLRAELTAVAGSADRLATASVLWKAVYTVVREVAASRPRVLVRRYEDLAADPLQGFEELYAATGLVWTERAADRVRVATGAQSHRGRGFSWNLKGVPSRTAFQPLDSRQALVKAGARLDQDQRRRVLALTGEVRDLFYD